MRISLLTATALTFALTAAGLSSQAPAAVKLDTQKAAASTPAATPGSSLSVRLHVSSTKALQYHAVTLTAQPSASDISVYVFVYGDGAVESSYQPSALHGYRKPGTYHARVGVLESNGQGAISAPVTIHVIDAVPPVVRIDQPGPGQRLRLGSGVRFAGSVHDPDGVSKVQLAIQLVSSARHFRTGGGCIWYDGATWLVLAGCSTPHFFDVSVSHGQWSFRMPANVRIPAGSYVVRVRAIDRAGNISHYYAVPLRTILPFELAR